MSYREEMNRRHIRWAMQLMDDMEKDPAVREVWEAECARRNERSARMIREQCADGCLFRVMHPSYGETVVRAKSNCSAMLMAAEAWGIDWMLIRDCTTQWVREDEKGMNTDEDQEDFETVSGQRYRPAV